MSVRGNASIPTEEELEAFLGEPEPSYTVTNVTAYNIHGNENPQNVTVLPDAVTPSGGYIEIDGVRHLMVDGVPIRVGTTADLERYATADVRERRREYQRKRRAAMTPEEHAAELAARRASAEAEAKSLTPEDMEARREYNRLKQARYRARKRLSSSPAPAVATPAPAPKTASAPPAPDPSDRRTTAYNELDALLHELAKPTP